MSKTKISPRLVEVLLADLQEARNNLETRESIWKRMVEDRVLEVVDIGRTATGRPGPDEEIHEIRFYPDEWMFRVFYGAEGTQPIRVPFDSINLPAHEVRAQVEEWHREYEEQARFRNLQKAIKPFQDRQMEIIREAFGKGLALEGWEKNPVSFENLAAPEEEDAEQLRAELSLAEAITALCKELGISLGTENVGSPRASVGAWWGVVPPTATYDFIDSILYTNRHLLSHQDKR